METLIPARETLVPPSSPTARTRPVRTDDSDVHAAWSAIEAVQPARTGPAQKRKASASGYQFRAALDMVRTKVGAVLKQNGWVSMGVTAPTRGCGTTTLAGALALSFARSPEARVVLVDLNLRHPAVASSFQVEGHFALESLLRRATDSTEGLVRVAPNLAVAFNTQAVSAPAELLQSESCRTALAQVRRRLRPTIVIYDVAPMLEHDDLLAALPLMDCVLLTVAAEMTSLDEVDLCERELSGRSRLMGVVLNRGRYES